MALNSSGPISIAGTVTGQSIQIELLGNGTTQMSLNDTSVRTLAGVASGEIVMPTNFYGKSNKFIASITSSQTNLDLRTWALANGWDGTVAVEITVNAGVYVYSTSTSNAGLTVTGSFPGGVTLINNGYIIGKGGNGGSNSGPTAGAPGGSAISLGINATIVNNSGAFIAGGGGGGGGQLSGGGGGAGGGDGGLGRFSYAGGTGGAIGSSGNNGGGGNLGGQGGGAGAGAGGVVQQSQTIGGGGGGGGRILPGTGGAGGLGAVVGGVGGSAGNPGSQANPGGYSVNFCSGGGGGWGAAGAAAAGGSIAGGAGGNAIALNGYSATTSGSGTTYGAVS